MALTTYHHGITATETSNITPIIKSVSMSTIALVSVSDDADDTEYPLDTPVLLTGITSTDVEKSGSDDQLLHQCLRTIKAIQNTSVVVLRLSEPVDVDTVDLLLSCQTSLGVTPKILIAPEIDTPAMTRKLVEIAKKRRAFVYASPRAEDGTLITVKEDIVAYRDTFAARELMLIEGGFGAPGKSKPSEGTGGGDDADADADEINFLLFNNETVPNDTTAGLVYSLNGGPLMEVIPTGQDKIIDVGEYVQRIALYDSEFVGFYESFMHLDKHALTGFGLSYLQSSPIFSSVLGDATDVLTTLTVYPANRLPSTNINYDLFNHIVDPESHTPTDIDRFAQYGISPAVKNPDGSYTLKSQMHLDFNLLSPPGSP